MSRNYGKFSTFLLLLSLLGLMTGCGDTNTQSSPVAISKTEQAMHELEYLLKAGEVDEAIALFDDTARLLVRNPLYLSVDETDSYISQQLSSDKEVNYQGKIWIKSYLLGLVQNHFSSSKSEYQGDKAVMLWRCKVRLVSAELIMEFKATFEGQKIKELIITNSQLFSWPVDASNSRLVNSTDLPVPIPNPAN